MNNNHSKSSTVKKVIVSVIALIAVIGGIFGARAYVSSGKTAGVIQVINLADTWVENASSGYGQISQGGTQMVFLDTSMLVYKIYVSPGDHVAKGDPLIQYDATQAKLAADNYRIRYEMAKRDLKEARERLEYLKTFRPYVEPTPVIKTFEGLVDTTYNPNPSDENLPDNISYTGSGTEEDPYVIVIDVNLDTPISKATFEDFLRIKERQYAPDPVVPGDEGENEGTEPVDPSIPPEGGNESAGTDPISSEGPTNPQSPTEPETPAEDKDRPFTLPDEYRFEFHVWESFGRNDSVIIAVVKDVTQRDETGKDPGKGRDFWFGRTFDATNENDTFTFSEWFEIDKSTGEVIDNRKKQDFENNQELSTDRYFDVSCRPSAYPDPVEIPEQNMYTQEEINEMILNQTQLIRSQELAVSQAELDYRKAKQTATDGIVRAAQDGTVTEVGDPYAPQGDKALIQVKGGDGYEITSTISELQLGSIKVGDEITITMWSNGMTYTGKIKEISPYSTTNNMSYEGQAGNVSYYPYTAVLTDCEDELQPWDGGEIRFMSDSSKSKALFLLQSSFIREENGRSYVLKANEEGRLEKQYIEVGRILYGGYMVEIYGGLSLEDYIAFPYGKNGVEGAKADYESGVMGW